jgi:hypothetical protein
MQLSDFLASFGRDFGSPRHRPTSVGQALVLPIDSATSTCACGRASFGDGLPALRKTGSPEEKQGPPRLPGHPLRTCRGATLRRTQPRLALLLKEKIYGTIDIAFTENRTLGNRNDYSFRSHVPTAHTLACLRFADLVTETVARLTTGSGGLTPGRTGFAPAGQQTKFQGDIAYPPIPIDQQCLVALFFLCATALFKASAGQEVTTPAAAARTYKPIRPAGAA